MLVGGSLASDNSVDASCSSDEVALLQMQNRNSVQVQQHQKQDPLNVHLGDAGTKFCTTSSVSRADCAEAVRLLKPEGVVQSAPEGSELRVSGSGNTPMECHVYVPTWLAVYNPATGGGAAQDDRRPVCTGATPAAHLGVLGSRVCTTASVSRELCAATVTSLIPEDADRTAPEGAEMRVSGSGNTPPGCHLYTPTMLSLYNPTSGTGRGRQERHPVCTGAVPT